MLKCLAHAQAFKPFSRFETVLMGQARQGQQLSIAQAMDRSIKRVANKDQNSRQREINELDR